MDAFIQHLRSPDFWIFSIALALALHIAAHYLQRLIDKSLSSGGSFLRAVSGRSRERRAARAKQISEWIDTHDDGAVLALMESHYLELGGGGSC
jgi:hypothetical protein